MVDVARDDREVALFRGKRCKRYIIGNVHLATVDAHHVRTQVRALDAHRAVRRGQRLGAHAIALRRALCYTVERDIVHVDRAVLERDSTTAEAE